MNELVQDCAAMNDINIYLYFFFGILFSLMKQQAISVNMAFDPKFIVFDGSKSEQSIVEGLEKAELIC